MSQGDRGILWYLVLGVLWPALASIAVLALARAAGRPGSALRTAAPGLAVGLGFAAGYLAIQGLPPLSFELTIRQWLFPTALVLALFAFHEARAGSSKPLARALLSVLLPLLLLEFQRRNHWSRGEGLAWTAGLAAFLFTSWQLGSAVERRSPSTLRALSLCLAGALAAGAYQLSGSLQIAQLGGALALSLGLGGLGARLLGVEALGPCSVGPYLGLHHGILWCAKFISSLSWTGFTLLALVPLAALLPRPRARAAAALVLLLPVLLAAAAALVEYRDQPAPYGS